MDLDKLLEELVDEINKDYKNSSIQENKLDIEPYITIK